MSEFSSFRVNKDQVGCSVVVTNLSLQCSKEQISEFFSFCGQIIQVELVASADGATQKAAIQFAKETAARTALLLSSAIIVDSQIIVTPYVASEKDEINAQVPPYTETDVFVDAHENPNELSQEDKPKSSIIVEIAAKGYVLNDKIHEKAKEFDEQHGVSTQFKHYIQSLKEKGLEVNDKYKISQNVQKTLQDIDQKYKVQEKIQQIDEKYHVKEKIDYAATTATSLANKALQTEAGQYVTGFLSKTWSTAKEINEDAKKQAEKEKEKEKRKSNTVNLEPIPAAAQEPKQESTDRKEPL